MKAAKEGRKGIKKGRKGIKGGMGTSREDELSRKEWCQGRKDTKEGRVSGR